jgi:putative oxidoreductase
VGFHTSVTDALHRSNATTIHHFNGGTMFSDTLSKYQPIALSVLRFYTGLSIIEHGLVKNFGFPTGAPYGMTTAGTLGWYGGLIELIGGALIIVGLFTRPVAFLMAGFTAVAYFMVHAPQNFFPIVNKGELAAVYCFVFLYLIFAGGGPLSLDAVLRKRS